VFIQKVISKVLNITKSSRFLGVFFFSVIGFSIGSYQYLDLPKFGKILFTDSTVQASPPWPE
jgi:hypothetical protein